MDIEKYISATCEKADIDFKASFDPKSNHEWCEIIKDVVAIANSGGGCIVVGRNDDGDLSAADIEPVLNLDPAEVSDKILKYTGCTYANFEIRSADFRGSKVACFVLGPCNVPLVFIKPGTYQVAGSPGVQKSAFSQGAVYFRHGAKSEPGTSEDLRAYLDREVERIRDEWLGNIRKVIEAPLGSQVTIGLPVVVDAKLTSGLLRLTNDPQAPIVRELNPNSTHPHRQKEVLSLLNEKMKGNCGVTSNDLLCVRRIHNIEGKAEFCHKPLHGSLHYSELFVDWLVQEFNKDKDFFDKAKQMHRVQQGRGELSKDGDPRVEWLVGYIRKTGISSSEVARKLGVAGSTVSLIVRGAYNGNRVKMLSRIEGLIAKEDPEWNKKIHKAK